MEQTPEETEIQNLKILTNLKKRTMLIKEIPTETRKLIDNELINIASINAKAGKDSTPEEKKALKAEAATCYAKIKELNIDFYNQISQDIK